MISWEATGSFKNTEAFLARIKRSDFGSLDDICRKGVGALKAATPVESGETAASWDYKIIKKKDRVEIHWTNRHVNDGVPIAILLQYGHGTGTGGYVRGRDFINPAMRPIFDELAARAWKAVTK